MDGVVDGLGVQHNTLLGKELHAVTERRSSHRPTLFRWCQLDSFRSSASPGSYAFRPSCAAAVSRDRIKWRTLEQYRTALYFKSNSMNADATQAQFIASSTHRRVKLGKDFRHHVAVGGVVARIHQVCAELQALDPLHDLARQLRHLKRR